MTSYSEIPLFDFVGPTFNRKYAWPGFYWYTLGDHIRSLEENGFQVVQVINLSPHYAKTIAGKTCSTASSRSAASSSARRRRREE